MSNKSGGTKHKEYLATTAGVTAGQAAVMSGADLYRAALVAAAGTPAGHATMDGARLMQLAAGAPLAPPQS